MLTDFSDEKTGTTNTKNTTMHTNKRTFFDITPPQEIQLLPWRSKAMKMNDREIDLDLVAFPGLKLCKVNKSYPYSNLS